MSELSKQSYKLAFYVAIINPELVEGGDASALTLLMNAYGIEGNPELELMKLWSKVCTPCPQLIQIDKC
jgi:hypothetical protein